MLFGGMEHALLPALRGGGDARKRTYKQLSKSRFGELIVRAESWGLDEIPEDIFRKILAKILVLSNNHISSIPPQLKSLTGLRVLKLNCNQIKTIPPEISSLIYLEEFNIADNLVSHVPSEMGMLVHLVKMNLSGNPLAGTAPGANKIWHSVWYEVTTESPGDALDEMNETSQAAEQAGRDNEVGAIENGQGRPQGWKETDFVLKKQTRVALDVLRNALPAAMAQGVRDKLTVMQMQAATTGLRKALCSADKVAIERALRSASLAGITPMDLSVHLATRALGIANQLSDAADVQGKQQLENALESWKEHRTDLEEYQPKWLTARWLTFSNGPDHERAKFALRQLTLKEIATGFRNMHNKENIRDPGKHSSGARSARSPEGKEIMADDTTNPKPQGNPILTKSMASNPSERVRSYGGRQGNDGPQTMLGLKLEQKALKRAHGSESYAQWLHNKRELEKNAQQQRKENQVKGKKDAELKSVGKIIKTFVDKETEDGWPSHVKDGFPDGTFAPPDAHVRDVRLWYNAISRINAKKRGLKQALFPGKRMRKKKGIPVKYSRGMGSKLWRNYITNSNKHRTVRGLKKRSIPYVPYQNELKRKQPQTPAFKKPRKWDFGYSSMPNRLRPRGVPVIPKKALTVPIPFKFNNRTPYRPGNFKPVLPGRAHMAPELRELDKKVKQDKSARKDNPDSGGENSLPRLSGPLKSNNGSARPSVPRNQDENQDPKLPHRRRWCCDKGTTNPDGVNAALGPATKAPADGGDSNKEKKRKRKSILMDYVEQLVDFESHKHRQQYLLLMFVELDASRGDNDPGLCTFQKPDGEMHPGSNDLFESTFGRAPENKSGNPELMFAFEDRLKSNEAYKAMLAALVANRRGKRANCSNVLDCKSKESMEKDSAVNNVNPEDNQACDKVAKRREVMGKMVALLHEITPHEERVTFLLLVRSEYEQQMGDLLMPESNKREKRRRKKRVLAEFVEQLVDFEAHEDRQKYLLFMFMLYDASEKGLKLPQFDSGATAEELQPDTGHLFKQTYGERSVDSPNNPLMAFGSMDELASKGPCEAALYANEGGGQIKQGHSESTVNNKDGEKSKPHAAKDKDDVENIEHGKAAERKKVAENFALELHGLEAGGDKIGYLSQMRSEYERQMGDLLMPESDKREKRRRKKRVLAEFVEQLVDFEVHEDRQKYLLFMFMLYDASEKGLKPPQFDSGATAEELQPDAGHLFKQTFGKRSGDGPDNPLMVFGSMDELASKGPCEAALYANEGGGQIKQGHSESTVNNKDGEKSKPHAAKDKDDVENKEHGKAAERKKVAENFALELHGLEAGGDKIGYLSQMRSEYEQALARSQPPNSPSLIGQEDQHRFNPEQAADESSKLDPRGGSGQEIEEDGIQVNPLHSQDSDTNVLSSGRNKQPGVKVVEELGQESGGQPLINNANESQVPDPGQENKSTSKDSGNGPIQGNISVDGTEAKAINEDRMERGPCPSNAQSNVPQGTQPNDKSDPKESCPDQDTVADKSNKACSEPLNSGKGDIDGDAHQEKEADSSLQCRHSQQADTTSSSESQNSISLKGAPPPTAHNSKQMLDPESRIARDPIAADARPKVNSSKGVLEPSEVHGPENPEVNFQVADASTGKQINGNFANPASDLTETPVDTKQEKSSDENDSFHGPETKAKTDRDGGKNDVDAIPAVKRSNRELKGRRQLSRDGPGGNSKATGPPRTSSMRGKKMKKNSPSVSEILDPDKAGNTTESSSNTKGTSGAPASDESPHSQDHNGLINNASDSQNMRSDLVPKPQKGFKATGTSEEVTPKAVLGKKDGLSGKISLPHIEDKENEGTPLARLSSSNAEEMVQPKKSGRSTEGSVVEHDVDESSRKKPNKGHRKQGKDSASMTPEGAPGMEISNEHQKNGKHLSQGGLRDEESAETSVLPGDVMKTGADARGENLSPSCSLDPQRALNASVPDEGSGDRTAAQHSSDVGKGIAKGGKGVHSKILETAQKSKSSAGGRKGAKKMSRVSSREKTAPKVPLSSTNSPRTGKKNEGKSHTPPGTSHANILLDVGSRSGGKSDGNPKDGSGVVLVEGNASERSSRIGAAQISVHGTKVVSSENDLRGYETSIGMSGQGYGGKYMVNAEGGQNLLLQSTEAYTQVVENLSKEGKDQPVERLDAPQFVEVRSAGIVLDGNVSADKDGQPQVMQHSAVFKVIEVHEDLQTERIQDQAVHAQSSNTDSMQMGSLVGASASCSQSDNVVRAVGSNEGKALLNSSAEIEGSKIEENAKAKMMRTRLDAEGNIIEVVEIDTEDASQLSHTGKIVKEDSTEHVVVNEGQASVEMSDDGKVVKVSTPVEVVKTVQKMRVREKVVQKMVEISESESETDSEAED